MSRHGGRTDAPPSMTLIAATITGGYSTSQVPIRPAVLAGDRVEATGIARQDSIPARSGRVGSERDRDDGNAHAGKEHEEEQEAPGGHRCDLSDRR